MVGTSDFILPGLCCLARLWSVGFAFSSRVPEPEWVGPESAGLLAGKLLTWPCGLRPTRGVWVFLMCVGEKRPFSIKSFWVLLDVKGEALDSLLSLSPQVQLLCRVQGAGRGQPRWQGGHLRSLSSPVVRLSETWWLCGCAALCRMRGSCVCVPCCVGWLTVVGVPCCVGWVTVAGVPCCVGWVTVVCVSRAVWDEWQLCVTCVVWDVWQLRVSRVVWDEWQLCVSHVVWDEWQLCVCPVLPQMEAWERPVLWRVIAQVGQLSWPQTFVFYFCVWLFLYLSLIYRAALSNCSPESYK